LLEKQNCYIVPKGLNSRLHIILLVKDMTTNSKEYSHDYYLKTRAKKLGQSADQYLKNREHLLELRHQRYLRQRADTSKQDHERYIKVRDEIIQLLGGKCSNPNCLVPNGCSDPRCLQIDHINGGGRKEVKSFPNSLAFYRFVLTQIKNGSINYQCLCSNCNQIKRFDNKEFRKKIVV
jgi:hypothetical protein